MKELSIEEKAKAYDEALEQARKELKTCGSLNCDAARQIFRFFPELTENEDEKIRKFLIKCVQQPIGTNLLNGIKKDDVIVWLEKQKGCIYTADDIITAEDHAFLAGADWQKEQNKKLEKQGKQKPAVIISKFKVGDSIKTANEEPLTITEITDNGYWSEDLFICNFDDAAKWEPVEQKPTWSEEDEMERERVVGLLEGWLSTFKETYYAKDCKRGIGWLKSLKDRVQPQSIQELSKEVIIEYVDLGLPSGTFWKSVNEEDYYTFDEAVEKFGDNLPNKNQWEELKDKCKWEWKGNGYEVTGPNGKSIFLPAAGYRYGTNTYGFVGMNGYYWSNMYASMYFHDKFHGIRYDGRNYGLSVRLVK